MICFAFFCLRYHMADIINLVNISGMRILNLFEVVPITRPQEVQAQRKMNVFLSIVYPRRFLTSGQILIYATITQLRIDKKQSTEKVIGVRRLLDIILVI